MSSGNIHISELDIVYYAPHVLREAASKEDVREIIDTDRASLSSSLQSFLADGKTSNVSSAYQLSSGDDSSDGLEPIDRKRFRLHELLNDMSATQASSFLSIPVPTSPNPLDLRPLVSCTIDVPWIYIDDRVPDLAGNFVAGNAIVLSSPAFGQSSHQIASVNVEQQGLLLRDADTLSGNTRADIVKVQCTDPVRLLEIQAFHEWRGRDDPDAGAGTISNFNESLYRILYAPEDASIAALGPKELYVHHIDRPGSIGNLSDLLRASNLPESEDRMRVKSRLLIDSGAAIEFAQPLSGQLEGVITSERASEGYSESIGLNSDRMIPTASAVRRMILEGGGGGLEGEKITKYLQVDGVLYAGSECEGVHCTSGLTVDGEIRCDYLSCQNEFQATNVRCRRISGVDWFCAQDASVCRLDVAEGAMTVSAKGLAVHAPELTARMCKLDDLIVDGSARVDHIEAVSSVSAQDVDVAGSFRCRTADVEDLMIHGSAIVPGALHAGSIEVGGVNVRAEFDTLRTLINDLYSKLA